MGCELKKVRVAQAVQWLGYWMYDRDSIPETGSEEIFSSPLRPDRLWSPPSLLSNGYWGVKRPECVGDHSPPSSVEIKNACCTSIPTYDLMAWCLVKHRDNFTLLYFTLLYVTWWAQEKVYKAIALSVRAPLTTFESRIDFQEKMVWTLCDWKPS